MKPVIKWPGGKASEYDKIKDLIPEYDRYIEPFFGGGGIFFREMPERAAVNDYNRLLVEFYLLVREQNKLFKSYLNQFKYTWNGMDCLFNVIKDELKDLFIRFRKYSPDTKGTPDKEVLKNQVSTILSANLPAFRRIFDERFTVDNRSLFNHLVQTVTDKIRRMIDLELKKGRSLSKGEIMDNLETGFRSGYYTHFRALLNDCNLGRRDLPREQHLAIFYFIREFCYGSMFRYNRKGEFNIPYGGISYNQKDFSSKIDSLFNQEIQRLLAGTDIYNLDFEEFLGQIGLNENDFVFFDPPYDTEFSTYGGNPFSKADHIRLARVIYNLPAKMIMIIKNTPFISKLYTGRRGIKLVSFDKLYSCNVRGRNDRNTSHLVIYNF